jgi:predicted HTH transcriptional regulator
MSFGSREKAAELERYLKQGSGHAFIEDCRKAKIKEPKWATSSSETSISFFATSLSTKGKRMEDLSDRQTDILKFLKEDGDLKASRIQELLGEGVTGRTVRNDLLDLIERGWISRRGQGPSTTYKLAEKSPKE